MTEALIIVSLFLGGVGGWFAGAWAIDRLTHRSDLWAMFGWQMLWAIAAVLLWALAIGITSFWYFGR